MDQRQGTEEVYYHQQYQGWWTRSQECVGIKNINKQYQYVQGNIQTTKRARLKNARSGGKMIE